MSIRLKSLRKALDVADDLESILNLYPIPSIDLSVYGVQIDEDDPSKIFVVIEVTEK